MLTKDLVQGGFVVALTGGEVAHDKHARQKELPAGYFLRRMAPTPTLQGGT